MAAMEPRRDDGDDTDGKPPMAGRLQAAMEPRRDDGDDVVDDGTVRGPDLAAMEPRRDDGDDLLRRVVGAQDVDRRNGAPS